MRDRGRWLSSSSLRVPGNGFRSRRADSRPEQRLNVVSTRFRAPLEPPVGPGSVRCSSSQTSREADMASSAIVASVHVAPLRFKASAWEWPAFLRDYHAQCSQKRRIPRPTIATVANAKWLD